jgi:hypothetical protein
LISILIPSIIDLLSKYNRLAALTMIIVGVVSTLTMCGMRESFFYVVWTIGNALCVYVLCFDFVFF